jgi:hypothetical protein
MQGSIGRECSHQSSGRVVTAVVIF